jgi:hypothetical protein
MDISMVSEPSYFHSCEEVIYHDPMISGTRAEYLEGHMTVGGRELEFTKV